MTEAPIKKENTVRILLDSTPREERLKAEYEEKLAEKNETIKGFLAKDALEEERKRAERVNDPPKAPIGDPSSTAPLEEPTHELRIQSEGSHVDPTWVKGESISEVIEKIEYLSKFADNKETYKKIMSKLTKKMLHDKPISLEFQGSVKDMATKIEKPIPEFCDEQTKKQATKK